MTVKLFIDSTEIPFDNGRFPAGETAIKLDRHQIENQMNISVHWLYQDDSELMQVLLLVRTIRQITPGKHINLYVPYFPHSRMDRVMEKGVPFSLVDVTDVINLCNFNGIYTEDNHSDAIETLLTDNVYLFNQPQHEGLLKLHHENVLSINPDDIFVSPDAGALKKIYKCAKALGIAEVVTASKNRDVFTGEITSTSVPDFLVTKVDQSIWVIDDICDGGRTFIELAKVLKSQHPNVLLKLYVTHGIFSKGIKLLKEYYNEVHCLHDMSKY